MKDAHTFYNNLLSKFKAERAQIPIGSISRSGEYFYERNGKKRKGITRNKSRIKELIRGNYLDIRISELEEVLESLEDCNKKIAIKNNAKAQIRNRFKNCKIDIEGILLEDCQKISIGHQSENPHKRERLELVTSKGVKVRSVSEQVIGNIFESLGIPYLYEPRITVDVTHIPGIKGARAVGGRLVKDYYPDFVILLADGSIFIHEHLGLIDDEVYRQANGEKIIVYTSSKTIDISRIILTYPDDIKDQRRFIKFLKEKVVPYV